MKQHLHPQAPFRIFVFSALTTIGAVIGVLIGKGLEAMFVTLVLVAVELAFSFDNAIVNAKVLKHLSSFWQTMFLTIGAAVAIFGMRLVFPVILVVLTAGLGWREVVDLALNQPHLYAEKLESSHVELSAFAGAFLLMLALHFFFDNRRQVLWLKQLELNMQRLAFVWAPALITVILVVIVTILPFNHAAKDTLTAGSLGVISYGIIHWISEALGRAQKKGLNQGVRVGAAGLVTFLYLQVLDSTFSFDGVLGAFAVTNDVILIAVGLGIGAMWVRSLTVYMVRNGTLDSYRFIEHGAYYTIGILSIVLLISVLVNVPELIAGLVGIGIITSSIVASKQAIAAPHRHKS
jgi:hypothetical protein